MSLAHHRVNSWSLRLAQSHRNLRLSFPNSLLHPPPSLLYQTIHRMASAQYESRDQSIGAFPISPRGPPGPPRTSGFRIKWHTLTSSARGLLCFYLDDRAYEDHWHDSLVALHSPAWSDVSWSCSGDDINEVHGRSHQMMHTENLAKHDGKTSGSDKTTTTKLSPTEHEPSSGAVASVNVPLIKDRGARRHGLANPFCDHAAFLHYIGARTRAEREVATGDSVETLIDAILQIADPSPQGCGGSRATPLGSKARSERATDDDPKGRAGAQGGEKKEGSTAGKETDAKRAWEAMKRRVMLVEEYGALPPGDSDAGEADAQMDHGAERASSECRAWRRRCWAEEAMRGQARDEASWRASTKKRRRYAGCWVRENDVFVRLVSEIFRFFLPSCLFFL